MQGLKLYKVGGIVRDELLGLESSDVDFTTPLTKEEIIQWCNNNKVKYFVANDKYDTVNIELFNNEYVEVTPFRIDVKTNGRHCETKYTPNIEDDLSRRDFTINAIASPIDKDGYIDPFNGIGDIKNKIIRTVGKAEERFEEDYLRILRGLRFAVSLNFSIEYNTWLAMKKLAKNVPNNVSKERIFNEIVKLFKTADKPSIFFDLLDDINLLEVYFPQLFNIKHNCSDQYTNPKYHPELTLYNHIKYCLDYSPKNNITLKFASLTHDLGKPFVAAVNEEGYYTYHKHEVFTDEVDKFFSPFNVSKTLINDCKFIMKNHMRMHQHLTKKTLKKLINKHGEDKIKLLIDFSIIDKCLITEGKIETITHRNFREIISDKNTKITPIVDGRIIMERLGVEGKRVGEIKNEMYDIQLEYSVEDIDEIFKIWGTK